MNAPINDIGTPVPTDYMTSAPFPRPSINGRITRSATRAAATATANALSSSSYTPISSSSTLSSPNTSYHRTEYVTASHILANSTSNNHSSNNANVGSIGSIFSSVRATSAVDDASVWQTLMIKNSTDLDTAAEDMFHVNVVSNLRNLLQEIDDTRWMFQ